MKKRNLSLIAVLSVLSLNAYSQWGFPTINTTTPVSDVRIGPTIDGNGSTDNNTGVIKWTAGGVNELGIFTWADGRAIRIGGTTVKFQHESGNPNNVFMSGKLGIGTLSPTARLEMKLATNANVPFLHFMNSNNQTKLFLDTSGKLGVGTGSPTAKLDVNGTANINGNTTITGNITATGSATFGGELAAQNKLTLTSLQTALVNSSDKLLYIKPNGEVYQSAYGTTSSWSLGGNNVPGLGYLTFGTTSFNTDIELQAGGFRIGWIYSQDKNLEYKYATTFGKLNAGYSSNHSTRIYPTITTGASNYNNHRIFSVHDAATSPVELFAVLPDTTHIRTSNTRISSSSTHINSQDVFVYDFASFNATGSNAGLFIMKGDVEIDGSVKVDNGGDLVDLDYQSGGVTLAEIDNVGRIIRGSSDARLKTNIEKIDDNLQKIMMLKPVKYNFIDTKKYGADKTLGFIAQDVEKVIPEVVRASADEYKLRSVNYHLIVPVLTGAIQEQQTQIEAQQKQIGELKAAIANLNNYNSNSTTGTGNYADGNTKGYLNQNVPNPFTQNTVISYRLPENTKTAALGVYDMNGKEVKLVNLSTEATGSVTIDGGSMQAGMYVYSLLIDGMPFETKRMVLTSH